MIRRAATGINPLPADHCQAPTGQLTLQRPGQAPSSAGQQPNPCVYTPSTFPTTIYDAEAKS